VGTMVLVFVPVIVGPQGPDDAKEFFEYMGIAGAVAVGAAVADGLRLGIRRRPAISGSRDRALTALFLLANLVLPIACLSAASFATVGHARSVPNNAAVFCVPFWLLTGVRLATRSAYGDVKTADDMRWSWKGAASGALLAPVMVTVVLELAMATLPLFSTPTLQEAGRSFMEWLGTSVSDPKLFLVRLINLRTMPLVVAGAVIGGFRPSMSTRAAGPYHSIRATARRSLRFGIVAALSFAAWSALINSVDEAEARSFWVVGLAEWWRDFEMEKDLTGAAMFVGLGVLAFGGVELVRHAALRVALRMTTPWPIACITLLDRTAKLALVRRAGSGYVFIHRMLLEYFADLPPPPSVRKL
jgi:hypothetical protein